MEQIIKAAEVQLRYKPSKVSKDFPVIKSSETAAAICRNFFSPETLSLQEEFIVLYLNRGNKLIGAYRLSKGGITGTVADLKLIFAVGLKLACSGIVLSHNHPSGSLSPSSNDRLLTEKVANAGKILEIKVLDHIIISTNGYLSFADEGLI